MILSIITIHLSLKKQFFYQLPLLIRQQRFSESQKESEVSEFRVQFKSELNLKSLN